MAITAKNPRVHFNHPPVVEVVCGVLFQTPNPLTGPHIGRFWGLVEEEFPGIMEHPPLPPVIEALGPVSTLELQLGNVPPLRRSWLISKDGRSLLQIQEDRFLFNWKKAGPDDGYPSYDVVIQKFDEYLDRFAAFLDKSEIGQPIHRQFELTYVNQIVLNRPTPSGPLQETDILVDHRRDTTPERFLPEPEAVNWVSVYPLPEHAGRLHIVAQTGRAPDGQKVLRLDLTARGIPTNTPEQNRRAWFDQAHVWITNGFADITAHKIQNQLWGRTA